VGEVVKRGIEFFGKIERERKKEREREREIGNPD
jgi:hypothetical protein